MVIALLCATFLAPTEVQAQTVSGPANNTVYEILVRSFYDSNGDGIGDINGLTHKLDYLNDGNPQTDSDLEIGIIWLMPIFPSMSYHGYNVNNYREIHPDYGTLENFDRLIRRAHERGVRIILDVPFNHTSNQHRWFRDAVKNPSTSPYRDYYHLIVGNIPHGNDWHWVKNDSGQQVYYFGDFGYDMPDLNMSNEKVKDEVIGPCKKVFSGLIVIGGPAVGISGAEMLSFLDLEFAIRGDGEASMVEFVNRLEKKLPLNGLGGLVRREKNRIVEDNPPMLVKDLDSLPCESIS